MPHAGVLTADGDMPPAKPSRLSRWFGGWTPGKRHVTCYSCTIRGCAACLHACIATSAACVDMHAARWWPSPAVQLLHVCPPAAALRKHARYTHHDVPSPWRHACMHARRIASQPPPNADHSAPSESTRTPNGRRPQAAGPRTGWNSRRRPRRASASGRRRSPSCGTPSRTCRVHTLAHARAPNSPRHGLGACPCVGRRPAQRSAVRSRLAEPQSAAATHIMGLGRGLAEAGLVEEEGPGGGSAAPRPLAVLRIAAVAPAPAA